MNEYEELGTLIPYWDGSYNLVDKAGVRIQIPFGENPQVFRRKSSQIGIKEAAQLPLEEKAIPLSLHKGIIEEFEDEIEQLLDKIADLTVEKEIARRKLRKSLLEDNS